ncbi:MAG: class I SAM-dependent methyltransferase [Promethearchaeota archaeon]
MGEICLKIRKEKAQALKEYLARENVLDRNRKPVIKDNHVYFPVVAIPRGFEKSKLYNYCSEEPGACPADSRKKKGKLVALISDKIPSDKIDSVPRSFNIIGSILIIEIKDELKEYSGLIIEKLLKIHPNIRTIYNKKSKRDGQHRTHQLEFLYGEDDPITVHLENGCRFKIDVRSTFFDPRLSNEHKRIVDLIERKKAGPEIRILDLFCGIGPFVVPMAKLGNTIIYCVDVNPIAIDFLKQNLKLNKINENKVHIFLMDANKFLTRTFQELIETPVFDHVILNLPHHAYEFIAKCYSIVKNTGYLHWYTIAPELTSMKDIISRNPDVDDIINQLNSLGKNYWDDSVLKGYMIGLKKIRDLKLDIVGITRVKAYAPYRFIYCFDLLKSS